MDPAQLLDPKGFAKAKAKSKKRMPLYGPQQTRKQPPESNEVRINIPSYDPKALLNPKSANKPANMTSKPDLDQDQDEVESNLSKIYERHHNVKNREAPVTVKRKSETQDDDSDVNHKRQKTTFDAGKGGILSERLKKEREAIANSNGTVQDTAPIDLTADDDDDVVVMVEPNNHEVCLGTLNAKANCNMIPAVSKSARAVKNIWPIAKLTINRQRGNGLVIELMDVTGKSFGRLEPQVAGALSALMDGADRSRFRVRAYLMPRPVKKDEKVGQYISEMLSIMLVLYSPRDKADSIGRFLSQKQQWLNPLPAGIARTAEYYNPQSRKEDHRPAHVINGVKRPANPQNITYSIRTVEEKQQMMDELFDKMMMHEDLPEMDADTDIIKTTLLTHQKQALRFMIDHEDAECTDVRSKLWELKQSRGKEEWHNLITNQINHKKPEPTMGGILADMMGLGKTLSMLALIASTKVQAKDFTRSDLPPQLASVKGAAVLKSTLLICPTSVLTNWQDQLRAHVIPGQLKLYLYHGPGRTQSLDELSKFHIVLSSYGTLASEFETKRNSKNALFKAKWFRVVLDEAHQIRNQNTIAYKAACAIHAERRWAVTGTPVQNKLDDLAALFNFLRVEPFNNPYVWAQHITAPFKTGNTDVIKDLRVLVDSLTLRRMKDTIELPNRYESIVRLQFSDEEKRLYQAFAAQSNMKLQTLTRGQNAIRGKGYSHVLKALLRLRMICCHGKELVPEEDLKDIQGYDATHPIDCGDDPENNVQSFVTEKDAYDTFEMSQAGDVNRCVVCDEVVAATLEDDEELSDTDEEVQSYSSDDDIFGYLTPCYHLIHGKCKAKFLDKLEKPLRADNYYYCPNDGDYVRNEYFALTNTGLNAYLEQKERKANLRKKEANFNPETFKASTKVQELVRQLQISAQETQDLPRSQPPIRSVVFSEWTSYLDLIGIGLDLAGIQYVRLDGNMHVSARAKVLERFRTDPDVHVLVVSIKAGGQGLNYTAANKVYLMEPQFNPGVEQQAIDRVHRIGQTRDVEITHFIMSESVEEGILAIQDKKVKLANLSLERKRTGAEDAKTRLEELRALFK